MGIEKALSDDLWLLQTGEKPSRVWNGSRPGLSPNQRWVRAAILFCQGHDRPLEEMIRQQQRRGLWYDEQLSTIYQALWLQGTFAAWAHARKNGRPGIAVALREMWYQTMGLWDLHYDGSGSIYTPGGRTLGHSPVRDFLFHRLKGAPWPDKPDAWWSRRAHRDIASLRLYDWTVSQGWQPRHDYKLKTPMTRYSWPSGEWALVLEDGIRCWSDPGYATTSLGGVLGPRKPGAGVEYRVYRGRGKDRRGEVWMSKPIGGDWRADDTSDSRAEHRQKERVHARVRVTERVLDGSRRGETFWWEDSIPLPGRIRDARKEVVG